MTVKNSLAYCAITRGSNVGGLVGKVDCEFLMEGCIFNGRLPSGAYAFVSSMTQGKIEDCLSVENTGVSINAGATSYFNNCNILKQAMNILLAMIFQIGLIIMEWHCQKVYTGLLLEFNL